MVATLRFSSCSKSFELILKTTTLFKWPKIFFVEMIRFLKSINTDDKIWIYSFATKAVHESNEWGLKCEEKPKRPYQSRSKINLMLTVFFDCRDVLHYEVLSK